MHACMSWPAAVSKELLAAKYAKVAPRCWTAWPLCWPQTALRQQRSIPADYCGAGHMGLGSIQKLLHGGRSRIATVGIFFNLEGTIKNLRSGDLRVFF
jgi:hypothetical protein